MILCGRAQKHEEALKILTSDKYAASSVAAEDYCINYGVSSKDLYSQFNPALLLLLKIYLKQDERKKRSRFYDFGLGILTRHAKSLGIQSVLEILPQDMALSDVEEFLAQALPSRAHEAREAMITRSLSNVFNLQVQCHLASEKQKFSEVYSDTVCMSCRKRIGDLVFAVYPNETIVHYNCTNGKLDQCPVTGENF